MTPVKAIRKNCLECSACSPKEVTLCQIEDCPLYPFRLGKNPNRKGKGGQGFAKKLVQKSLVESD